MEIKINGKTFAAIIALSATFSFANYVSIISNDSSIFSVSEEKVTDEDIKDAILSSMPIGSITLRMDSTNPKDIYGGDWELLDGDAALFLGNGNTQSSSIVGNNSVSVPLVEHSHTKGTMRITGNTGVAHPSSPYGNSIYGSGALRGESIQTGISWTSGTNTTYRTKIDTDLGGWSGSTSVEGVSDAKIDVRGARLYINVWKRIS